jgi:ferrous iron transport protein B
VQVLDAKNLRRGLRLTMELAEFGRPMVIVLNMMDEALERGLKIDSERIGEILGVPVVETVATTGDGISDLKRAVARAAVPTAAVTYPGEIERALEKFNGSIRPDYGARRAVSLALLSGDESALAWAHRGLSRDGSEAALLKTASSAASAFVRPPRLLVFDARDAWAAQAAAETVSVGGRIPAKWSARIGRWCMRPWPGYLIAAGVLWLMYQFVGVFGAGTAVDYLENTVFGQYLTPAAEKLIETFLPWEFLQDMLVGPYGVISMAFTYAFALILPIVTTFFLAFGLLEDSGYLPRLSVMMDRLFRAMGLNGRAVLPMVLGLGCDTMATVTTRVLDTHKERIIVTILLSLTIPCSAQLAVILGMTAGMSWKIMTLWLTVVAGTTMLVGWGASRFLPGSRSSFLMEIPPVRLPILRNIFLKIKARLKWYMKEVVPLFVWGTLVLFFMDKLGWLTVVRDASAPLVQGFLGLPAQATEALIIGFLRRDYGAAGLYHLHQENMLSPAQVAVSLVLITLVMPCIAQWMMVVKERGWKLALGITAFVLVFAFLFSGFVRYVLMLFPGLVA